MKKFFWLTLGIGLGLIAIVALVFVGLQKEEQAMAEARVMCSDPAFSYRQGRTIEQCFNTLRSYYWLNKRLPSKTVSTPKQTEAEKATYVPEPPTVNLPAGEKFVAYVPANTSTWGSEQFKFNNLYITEKRPETEKPRRLSFFIPGHSPHSMEVLFYIQEH